MTGIRDHAERGGGPEVVLTSDLPQSGRGEILSADLVDADEVTDEGTFPQHGSFLEVETDDGEEYWECPAGLATAIVERADEMEAEIPGLWLSVETVSKTPSGEWRFVLSVSEE